jgi:eukaryotic-like serine/threonine-protein kinase
LLYTHVRELGRGGFGVVDLVRDSDGREFARKTLVIPPQLNPNHVKARFEREVRFQSAIEHENVIRIVDYDLSADPPWFVMHLAECSLQEELQVDRTMGGDPRKALFDTLSGLEEIHRRGYLHRDLKPANILKLSSSGSKVRYALSDFGLMAVGEDASSAITPSGMGAGTPAYQAPECAINFKRASPRSDIYSFGALLHDIFAPNPKRLPHDELTAPGTVGTVIEKCTKRNAHRRYRDVAEVREVLFEALNSFIFEFQSGEEELIVGLLTDEEKQPGPEQWDRIFGFLDDNEENTKAAANVFRALRRDHIDQLAQEDPDLLGALGHQFADHCRNNPFDFDYCDVLAAKAQRFYDGGDVQLKAVIAVAMLMLGTSHNRWFVERKFMQMAGTTIPDELAARILVEMEVLKIDLREQFAHLALSIAADKAALHPMLAARL